ncbi:cordon-bleu protein-like 1 [Nerophis ophidion]|uniref:cordon-bleu protein-like 1 n=1 Tax=Nerophis ophidion TaxID=159077 RepID=UPI002AE06E65|nr:cordon-bleu protein-like 1 [Nerophis ophidion]
MGSLKAETVVLTPHGTKDKIKSPNMPEVTVRLLINYNKSHKTVVRVSPQVPIERLLPVLCEKCDLRVETTVLLRDDRSQEPLDINKTLNEHGIRELYAEGRTDKNPLVDLYQPSTDAAANMTPVQHLEDMSFKTKRQQENYKFLSLFGRPKKKADMERAVSPLTSSGLHKHKSADATKQNLSYPHTLRADMLKKRQAPAPPMGVSQTIPNNFNHLKGSQGSAATNLKRPKRKAPPPPIVNTLQDLLVDTPDEGQMSDR